jgi:SHS family lactate transporter-like MFS transporter
LDEKAAISKVTATQTIANFGGLIGGTTIGYGSQIFGRRFSIIVMMVIAGCLLYPYTFTNGNRIAAAAFFEQFCIQGAFGVIPIHLIELSPAGFRTLIVGTSYQTGVLLASASNTILSKIADYYPVPLDARTGSILSDYDFRIPICAFSGAVFAYVIIMVAIGPEKRGIEMAGEETDDSDADFGVAPGTRATTTQIT